MATISRRGMFASVLHPDAEDSVSGATPKVGGGVMRPTMGQFVGDRLTNSFGLGGIIPESVPKIREDQIPQQAQAAPVLPFSQRLKRTGQPPAPAGSVPAASPTFNAENQYPVKTPKPQGVMAGAVKPLPANHPTAPVDPVRSGQQAPAAAAVTATAPAPVAPTTVTATPVAPAAAVVQPGTTMVPVQGLSRGTASIGVPTEQTVGRGVMTARSANLERNLDEYGRGQDATPYSPNAATNQIAADMQAKNAAIDAKAPGILSAMQRRVDPRERASLALEQRFRNVDQPAADARNAAELARQQEVSVGLRGQGADAADKEAAGKVGAAEAGARGIMGAAEATGKASVETEKERTIGVMGAAKEEAAGKVGAAQAEAQGAQSMARVADITRQADRDFRAALAADRTGAAAARVVSGLRAQAAKLAVVPKGVEAKDHEESTKVAIQQLNDLATQYEQEIGQATGGNGGGGLDGIPTWRPTK